MPDSTPPSVLELLEFALGLADAADRLTMRYYRAADIDVQAKADTSLVTRADLEVETALRAAISARFPEHAILGEEHGYRAGAAGSGVRWLIDPVDGTNSFGRGIPVWATLVACEVDGRPQLGVASAPALGTRWWAGRGLGAYRAPVPFAGAPLEAERIAVSAVGAIEQAQVLYGSYHLTLNAWGGRADALLRAAWRTRGFSDFWGHALVAEGSAEAMLEGEISPWDIAAMLVIVEEAGGRLTDIEGRATIEAGHAIASNGALHEELLRRLRG